MRKVGYFGNTKNALLKKVATHYGLIAKASIRHTSRGSNPTCSQVLMQIDERMQAIVDLPLIIQEVKRLREAKEQLLAR